jgi:hypothetical protein
MERSAIRVTVWRAAPDFAALHPGYGLARKTEFPEADQSDLACPVPLEKIFRFMFHPNQFHKSRRLTPLEGRIAIVTDAGWDAMDADALLTNSA